MRFWMVPLFFLSACVTVPEPPVPLAEREPSVLYLAPSGDQALPLQPQLLIFFSTSLETSSLDADSLCLVSGAIREDLKADYSQLKKAMGKDLKTVPISLLLQENGRVVLLSPTEPLEPDTDYTVLVTPKVLSVERLPLSQDPQRGNVPFFQLYHTISLSDEDSSNPDPTSLPVPGSGSSSGSGEAEDPAANDTSVSGPVVMNEIFYDAVGSDTDGVLFVELYGTPGLSLGGFQILFLNGDNGIKTDSITLPETATVGSDGFYLIADSREGQPTATQVPGADLVDNFDPQNGPDAVQLLNANGELVDAVGYGEGVSATGENRLAAFEGRVAPDVSSGHSLERSSPGQDTDDNRTDFVDRATPTPGN